MKHWPGKYWKFLRFGLELLCERLPSSPRNIPATAAGKPVHTPESVRTDYWRLLIFGLFYYPILKLEHHLETLRRSITVKTNRVFSRWRYTHLGVLTQTMPMWQKKIHSLSFWFSQEQRFSRRWAVWVSCTRGPSSAVGLVTEKVEAGKYKWEVGTAGRDPELFLNLVTHSWLTLTTFQEAYCKYSECYPHHAVHANDIHSETSPRFGFNEWTEHD